MRDTRNELLPKILPSYSIELPPGEKIFLEIRGHDTLELAKEVIRQATHLGGVPFWYYNDSSVTRPFIQGASEAQFEALG